MDNLEQAIRDLVKKAAKTEDSGDAMRFSQAALNAANAAATLDNIRRKIAET